MGKNWEVLQAVSKVVSKFKSGIQDVKFKFLLGEDGTEDSNFIASKKFRDQEHSEYVKNKMWRSKQCGVFWDLILEMKKFDSNEQWRI